MKFNDVFRMKVALKEALTELIDEATLKRLLDSFRETTGLGTVLLGEEGLEAGGFMDSEENPFCVEVHKTSAGRACCAKDHVVAAKRASSYGEPYIFICHAGMVKFCSALLSDGELIGSIICGPLLMRPAGSYLKQEVQRRTSDLAVDARLLLRRLASVPVLPERRVQAAADLLFTVTNYIMKLGLTSQMQKRAIAEQQARLAQELYRRKQLEGELYGSGDSEGGLLHPHYPFHKEEELIRLVQLGDERGAKRILDELLADILFKGAGQMELTKARILELVIILSRAAVEGGASLEEVLGLRYHCIEDLAEGMPAENLYYWILTVLDRLMACMYQNRNIRHPRVFSRAKEYIWSNYSRRLSQAEVAREVGLSTSYLSRLFRQEMGTSFSEYLTSVRIAAGKRLMETTDLPLLDIIHQVGYEDPSHFSKLFKRSEGVTPSAWRAKAKIIPREELT